MLFWTYSGRICTKGKLGISFPKQNSLSDTATLGTKQATEKRYFILIIMGRDHLPTATHNMSTAQFSSRCISNAERQFVLKLIRCDIDSARNTQDYEDYFPTPDTYSKSFKSMKRTGILRATPYPRFWRMIYTKRRHLLRSYSWRNVHHVASKSAKYAEHRSTPVPSPIKRLRRIRKCQMVLFQLLTTFYIRYI